MKIKQLLKDIESEKHQRRSLEDELKMREEACDLKGISFYILYIHIV